MNNITNLITTTHTDGITTYLVDDIIVGLNAGTGLHVLHGCGILFEGQAIRGFLTTEELESV